MLNPFLKKEMFISNTIEENSFIKIDLEADKNIYILSDSIPAGVNIDVTPNLKGAEIIQVGNQLSLQISDLLKFIEMKRFVVYY
jgi:hypothetical protein